MEPWSATYRSYEGGRANYKNTDIVTVKNGNNNNNNNINKMFVGPSARARPLDLPGFPGAHKTKKRSSGSGSGSGSWWNDPETKRRRRVAKYKLYSAEGKFKASIKHGFRWIKRKCSQIVRGF